MLTEYRAALRRYRSAIWRGYKRVPRPIRWPFTLLASFFILVILANLSFGGAVQDVERRFVIAPGQERTMEIQIDPGRNVEVKWQPSDPGTQSALPILATLVGPGITLTVDAPTLSDRFFFKGGFSRAPFQLRLVNPSSDLAAGVRVHWILR